MTSSFRDCRANKTRRARKITPRAGHGYQSLRYFHTFQCGFFVQVWSQRRFDPRWSVLSLYRATTSAGRCPTTSATSRDSKVEITAKRTYEVPPRATRDELVTFDTVWRAIIADEYYNETANDLETYAFDFFPFRRSDSRESSSDGFPETRNNSTNHRNDGTVSFRR